MCRPARPDEIAALPQLAPLLPLPIPVPTLIGRPSEAFAWPFYGAPFLPGREISDASLDDDARARLARPLAEFLRALHAAELDHDLPIDPVKRADMAWRVPRAREFLAEVESLGLWRAPPEVEDLFATAQELPVPEPSVTAHGDLHLRHLLVSESGDPTAVLCAVLGLWGHHEGVESIKREAIAGLERTVRN